MINAKLLLDEKSILQFCLGHKSIYLYGAGDFGSIYLDYLYSRNIHNIKGFLVTEKITDRYKGLPVYQADECLGELTNDSGVILSISRKYREDIIKDSTSPCPVAFCDDGLINVLSCNRFMCKLKKLGGGSSKVKKNSIIDGKKILIVQVEHTFGDVIWSTGFLRELRKNYPNSYIAIILNSKIKSLVQYCPYVNEVIGYDLNRSVMDICTEDDCQKAMDFCIQNALAYDVVYLPRLLPLHRYELWENLFIAVGCGANIRVAHITTHMDYMKIMADKFEDIFSKIIRHDKGEHEAFRNLMLLSNSGGKVNQYQMELWLSKKEIAYSDSLLNNFSKNKTVFVAVGLVGSNPVRSWDPKKYNHLFKLLLKKYYNIIFVLCGGLDAVEAAQEAKKNVENCIDLTGKTNLLQVAAVISRCDIYIGADTGIMHMASAFGKPIIELSCSLPDSPDTFGSHPVRTGPWEVFGIVLKPPHGLDECKFVCKKNYAHCINLISINDVFDAVTVMFERLYKK